MQSESVEVIVISKNKDDKYECYADLKGEHFEKVCSDLLMATAWAETVADYCVCGGNK